MKAMSLPIDVVVIVIIAVLVLLAVAAFFSGGFLSARASISDTDALNKGCAIWRAKGCSGTEQIEQLMIAGYSSSMKEACIAVLFGEASKADATTVTAKCQQYCCGRSD